MSDTPVLPALPDVSDEPPRFTTAGHQFRRFTWALIHDRAIVKITRTHSPAEHPFALIEGAPAAYDITRGQKEVPERGWAVVDITPVEGFAQVGTSVDRWGNPKPDHGSHY